MQRMGGGIAGPSAVSLAASVTACIPDVSYAEKFRNAVLLAEPLGDPPREPRNPVSTSLPMLTTSGITPAAR